VAEADSETLQEKKARGDIFSSLFQDNLYVGKSGWTPGLIKTGKPFIEVGTKVDILILGMAFPDIKAMVSNANILNRMFQSIFIPKDIQKADTIEQAWDNTGKSLEETKEEIKKSTETIVDDIKDWWASDLVKSSNSRMFPGGLKNYVESYKSSQNLIPGGAEPDFYGINVRSLFQEQFVFLEKILYDAKNFYSPTISMGDLITGYIDKLDRELRYIESFLKQIEIVIEDILALLLINISILKISTTGGEQDIYDQIVNSKDFPTNGSQRPYYHIGFVFCSVLPTANFQSINDTRNINLIKYWEETQKDYDTSLKEEVTNLNNGVQDLQKILGI